LLGTGGYDRLKQLLWHCCHINIMNLSDTGASTLMDYEYASIAQHRIKNIHQLDYVFSPSEAATSKRFKQMQIINKEPMILCHRPPGATAIPVTLIHPVFGEFLDNCSKIIPTNADYDLVNSLSEEMADLYEEESKRNHRFLSLVEKYYGVQFSTQIRDTKYQTDGNLREGDFYYVNVESKNELGSGGAEPNIQSAYYYVEFVRSHSKNYPWSPLPCLHVCLAGPYIGFSGLISSKKVQMDPLTPLVPFAFHPRDTQMRMM
ncbi:2693_t:CDS:2, partial [Ambispora leptoticha]